MESTSSTSISHNACIPPILHYCWFGRGEKPERVRRCIASWQKQLPAYELREWNESNFDSDVIPYTAQAYARKKYAFVGDYARLWVLQRYGGIYLDTDVEVLKPLDRFRLHDCFFGFENDRGVAPGLIMGCRAGHPILQELMDYYEHNSFVGEDGTINTYTTVQNCTAVLLRHGLKLDASLRQTLGDITVYEQSVFCPDKTARETGCYAPETFTAHHYAASWRTESYNRKLNNPLWRALVESSAWAGKCAAKVFGQNRWDTIKRRYLGGLYDSLRGVKDK